MVTMPDVPAAAATPNRWRAMLAGAALLATAGTADATTEDFGLWLGQTALVDAGSGKLVWLEAQQRYADDATRLGQLLVRPAVGYRIGKGATVWLGYAFVRTNPTATISFDEHRMFQQLSLPILRTGSGIVLAGRTRVEQRFIDGDGKMAWRLRQQLSLTLPLDEKVSAVVWTEPFIGINETARQRSGIGLWRNFVGLAVPLGQHAMLSPGYLRQDVQLLGRRRTDHIMNFTLSLNL